MTRLWAVPPECLCDHTDDRTDNNHLLGEHAEMHQEVGTFLRHPHGEAVVRGHAADAQVQLSRIEYRHDILAREMASRGFEHDSPLSFDLHEHRVADLGYVDPHANLVDLYNRCDDCAARIDARGGFA